MGDEGRHVRVHGPSQRQVPLRAEFVASHEHNVRRLGQTLDGAFVEQITTDCFDPACLQPLFDPRFTEPRHADHAPLGNRRFRKPCQRRPHLASDAQDYDVARNLAKILDQGLAGTTEQFLQRGNIRDRPRQRFSGQKHDLLPLLLQPDIADSEHPFKRKHKAVQRNSEEGKQQDSHNHRGGIERGLHLDH